MIKNALVCFILTISASCATSGWLVREVLPPILASPELAEALHEDMVSAVSFGLHYVPYGSVIEPYVRAVISHSEEEI